MTGGTSGASGRRPKRSLIELTEGFYVDTEVSNWRRCCTTSAITISRRRYTVAPRMTRDGCDLHAEADLIDHVPNVATLSFKGANVEHR